MSKNYLSTICKWVSIILVVVSVGLLFAGDIRFASKDDMRFFRSSEFEDGVDEIIDALDEVDAISDYREIEDELGIDVDDLMDVLDDTKKGFKRAQKILEDGKFSTSEIALITPKIIKVSNKILDNKNLKRMMRSDMGSDFDKMMEIVENIKAGMIFIMVMFYLTLIVGVVTLILRFINSKLPGVTLAVMNLAIMITWIVCKNKVNTFFEDELDTYDHVLKLTAAPIWAFVLALLAVIIWLAGNYIVTSGVNMRGTTSPASRRAPGADPNAVICTNCGNKLRPGAVFCPACGEKYSAPVRSIQPTAYQSDNSVGVAAATVCPNCGAKLDSDAMFCGECGYKRS